MSMPSFASLRSTAIQRRLAPVVDLLSDPAIESRGSHPLACDFLFGNPHDTPLPGFVRALQAQVEPQNKDWFAYKMSEPAARHAVAGGLRSWRGVEYQVDDIFLTTGAFAGLAVVLNAVLDPGDEVIFISPPWFFYEALILQAGGVPVRVRVRPKTFDLDFEAISSALTLQTRALILNSPNNPTGRVYPAADLERLAEILRPASERNGRPVYLLSDEAYSRILYDGRSYASPTAFYPSSFLIYTYGKTLLTPGQRIGYVALPPEMPGREELRRAITVAQFTTAYSWPNALLQHAIADLDRLSIDVERLQRRRDRMVAGLRQMGYELHTPEGTFYLLLRSPWEDDLAFTRMLTEHHIFCLPGSVFEMPGHFRISLTASDEMIERSMPGFEAAIRHARSREPAAIAAS
jgi:aspartate aminotransferase